MAGIFVNQSLSPVLRGIARNYAAEADTAGEQQQAATRDQCHVESGERQDTTIIGVRRLGRDARLSASAGVAASSSACAYLPCCTATRTGIGIRSRLCECGRSQNEDGNNGCKYADSSN
jgi:hypothetical protein